VISWFVHGLRRRVVTTRYPAMPEPSVRALPAPPAFDPCQLSRSLAEQLELICPSGALSVAGPMLRYDVGACTACGRCQQLAGAAVRSSGLIELATADRGHLVKQIPILGDPDG